MPTEGKGSRMNTSTKKMIAALCLAAPVLALAQTATPGVDQRLQNQEARIQQGVQSGSLTQREAVRLERGETQIRNMENRAKADGVVTQRERVRLQRAEDHQSERIYREKHDRQHDFNHDGRKDRPHRRG